MPEARLDPIAALPFETATGSHNRLLRGLESLADPLAVALSLWAVAAWQDGAVSPAWLLASVLGFALAYPGRPRLHAPWPQAVAGILAGWSAVVALLLLAGVATGAWPMLSARVAWHWLWAAPALQLAAHAGLRRAAPLLVRLQGPALRAVLVGLNPQGLALADRLAGTRDAGITLLGCFDDRKPGRLPGSDRHRLLGPLAQVADFVRAQGVQRIYLSLPMAPQPRIHRLLESLKDTTASVYFVPDLFVTDLIQGHADTVCGLPVISVCDTPFRGPAGLLKRASDLVLAGAILLLSAPLLLAVALAVRLDSPGPVIFRQRRYGLDGREIIVYKFRSMRVVEDGPVIEQAHRGDARITRIGAFLRRTSLDEMPQFINVLQGRMSVVGPRPHAVAHNEFYRQQIRSYMLRHKVRPGITGWAQVNGFRGETDSLQKMEGRIRHDLDYLRHWSLWLDLYIVLRTVRAVWADRSAY